MQYGLMQYGLMHYVLSDGRCDAIIWSFAML
jgi:hypothetical protein